MTQVSQRYMSKREKMRWTAVHVNLKNPEIMRSNNIKHGQTYTSKKFASNGMSSSRYQTRYQIDEY